MFEKWRTARTARGAESGGREESVASVAPAAAPGDAWRALPPVQRVLDAGPRTIAEHGFSTSLATHWNPSFQSDLGHGAVPDAPGGVMLDAVRPVPVRESAGRPEGAELPGLRLPVAGSVEAGSPSASGSASGSGDGAGLCPRAAREGGAPRRRPFSVCP